MWGSCRFINIVGYVWVKCSSKSLLLFTVQPDFLSYTIFLSLPSFGFSIISLYLTMYFSASLLILSLLSYYCPPVSSSFNPRSQPFLSHHSSDIFIHPSTFFSPPSFSTSASLPTFVDFLLFLCLSSLCLLDHEECHTHKELMSRNRHTKNMFIQVR